jgi:hypothetical protein
MPYLGNVPAEAYTNTVKDSFNGDGSTTAFTLSQPSTTNNLRVVVENVIQDPTVAYTVSGTTLTFTSAPPTGTANIYAVHLGPATQTAVPPSEINNATTFTDGITVDKDGAAVITADRASSDGTIIDLQKDGTTVGSIASDSGSVMIGSGDVGVYFDAGSDRIIPMNMSTLSVRNDAIDIGGNPHRFNNLYLSGGVYLGGTGSANYLDEYEEGTWTPTLVGAVSYGQQWGSYIKVGNVVHFTVFVTISSGATGNQLRVTLPFASLSGTDRYHAYRGWQNSWSSSGNSVQWVHSAGNAYIVAYNLVSSGSVSDITETNMGTGNFIVTGSYRIA